jgi:hypothetical protein
MFEIERDADPRRDALYVTSAEGRFVVAGDGRVLCLTVREARRLVEVLMTETMRINLFAEQEEHEE